MPFADSDVAIILLLLEFFITSIGTVDSSDDMKQ